MNITDLKGISCGLIYGMTSCGLCYPGVLWKDDQYYSALSNNRPMLLQALQCYGMLCNVP